jgi:hypothetical protein
VATYLLGTACLVDIARGEGAAYEWYRGLEAQEGLFAPNVEISAFSVAAIELQFEAEPPRTPRESTLKQNLVALVSQFRIDGAIVGAAPDVIEYWSQRLNYDIPYPEPGFPDDVLGFEEKLVLATAKVGNEGRGYILVDRKRPVHDDLELLVHDPYA